MPFPLNWLFIFKIEYFEFELELDVDVCFARTDAMEFDAVVGVVVEDFSDEFELTCDIFQ